MAMIPTSTCRLSMINGPKTMAVLHSLCEVVISGGDFTLLGGNKVNEIDISCADGVVRLKLISKQIS